MSGDHISLLDFVYGLKDEIDALYVHPIAAEAIHWYFSEMFEAAAAGDAHEVKRLAQLVRWRIEHEHRMGACCDG